MNSLSRDIMKLLKKELILLFASLTFIFFVSELVLLFFPQLLPNDIQRLMDRGPYDPQLEDIPMYLDDPDVGFILNPAYPNIISLGFQEAGFRDDGINSSKTPAVFVGDSFTYGWFVDQNETFVELLEQQSTLDVINLGVGSYSSLNNLFILKKYGITFTPKVIFWGLFQNDYVDSVGTLSWQESNLTYSGYIDVIRKGDTTVPFYSLRYFLAKNSALYNLIKFPFKKDEFIKKEKQFYDEESDLFFRVDYLEEVTNTANPDYIKGLSLTKQAILDAQAIATYHNATFVVVIIPSKEQVYHLILETKYDQTNLTTAIERIIYFCQTENITCINLLPYLEEHARAGEKLYFTDDGHFNELGHFYTAEIILDYLSANNISSMK